MQYQLFKSALFAVLLSASSLFAAFPTATDVNITGTLTENQELNVTYTYTDADGDPENGTRFEWYQDPDGFGFSPTLIASTRTYTLQASDVGKFIKVAVYPKNLIDGEGVAVESAWGGPVSAFDTTPPVFETNTTVTNIASTTATLNYDIDENGSVYYVVLASGAFPPMSGQVKAGTDSNDNPAINGSGSVSNSPDFNGTLPIAGLSASTTYDLYVVAEDMASTPNLQFMPTKVTFTTTVAADAIPPTLTASAGSVTATTVKFSYATTEAGKVYYAVVSQGTATPTSAQLKDKTVSGSVASGEVTVTSPLSGTVDISGLTKSTAYTLYAVAEDAALNPSAVKSANFTTLTPLTLTFKNVSGVVENKENAEVATLNPGGGSGSYSYELVGTDRSSFTINGKTVYFNGTYDYEAHKKTFRLEVTLKDSNGATTTAWTNIKGVDVNEAPTKITYTPESGIVATSGGIKVKENFTGDLATFSTEDPDADETFTYSICSSDANAFGFNDNVLMLKTPLDFEKLSPPTFTLCIRSTDEGGVNKDMPLSKDMTLTIEVTDEKEAPTGIILTSGGKPVTFISETLSAGSTVGVLNTIDEDTGDTFTYALCGGESVSITELSEQPAPKKAGGFDLNPDLGTSEATFELSTGDNSNELVVGFSGIPHSEHERNVSICIRTTEGSLLSAGEKLWYEGNVSFIIKPANRPPKIEVPASGLNATIGKGFVYNPNITDPDGDDFNWSVVNENALPPGVNLRHLIENNDTKTELFKTDQYSFNEMMMDNDGNIYVIDTAKKQVLKYSKDGQVIRNFNLNVTPSHITYDPVGNFFVVSNDTIYKYDSSFNVIAEKNLKNELHLTNNMDLSKVFMGTQGNVFVVGTENGTRNYNMGMTTLNTATLNMYELNINSLELEATTNIAETNFSSVGFQLDAVKADDWLYVAVEMVSAYNNNYEGPYIRSLSVVKINIVDGNKKWYDDVYSLSGDDRVRDARSKDRLVLAADSEQMLFYNYREAGANNKFIYRKNNVYRTYNVDQENQEDNFDKEEDVQDMLIAKNGDLYVLTSSSIIRYQGSKPIIAGVPDKLGEYQISINAVDEWNAASSASLALSVTNKAPVVASTPSTTVLKTGDVFKHAMPSVQDPDGHKFTWSVGTLPEGVSYTNNVARSELTTVSNPLFSLDCFKFVWFGADARQCVMADSDPSGYYVKFLPNDVKKTGKNLFSSIVYDDQSFGTYYFAESNLTAQTGSIFKRDLKDSEEKFSKESDRLRIIWGMTMDKNGNLYVADGNFSAFSIYKYNTKTSAREVYAANLSSLPRGLVCDSDGALLVSYGNSTIHRYKNPNVPELFSTQGTLTTGMALGKDGLVYALESQYLVRFDKEGNKKVLDKLDSNPTVISSDNLGTIYVATFEKKIYEYQIQDSLSLVGMVSKVGSYIIKLTATDYFGAQTELPLFIEVEDILLSEQKTGVTATVGKTTSGNDGSSTFEAKLKNDGTGATAGAQTVSTKLNVIQTTTESGTRLTTTKQNSDGTKRDVTVNMNSNGTIEILSTTTDANGKVVSTRVSITDPNAKVTINDDGTVTVTQSGSQPIKLQNGGNELNGSGIKTVETSSDGKKTNFTMSTGGSITIGKK